MREDSLARAVAFIWRNARLPSPPSSTAFYGGPANLPWARPTSDQPNCAHDSCGVVAALTLSVYAPNIPTAVPHQHHVGGSMKRYLKALVLSPIVAFAITIVGGITGVLPDACPRFAGRVIARRLLVAMDQLGRFEHKDAEGESYSLVSVGDVGHAQLYGLLRSVDPTVPRLGDIPSSASYPSAGAIISTHASLGFTYSGGGISPFTYVAVVLANGALKPVCEIRDLTWRIQEGIDQSWSTISLIAVVVGAILALGQSRHKQQESP